MALDERYITAVDLTEPFIDKITGQPLAGGKIYFWQDDNRLYPKTVFELSGAPPNYTYTALPNPLTLGADGCPQNNNGDNVSIYYYPYDAFGNLELYYIQVVDSDGLDQFTRQGWPNVAAGSDPTTSNNASMSNELSNGQFADVFFDPSQTLTISFTGSATKTVDIAPDWQIEIAHGGNGNVQITRNAKSGTQLVSTNAPYTLTVVPSSNINSLKLIQKLNNNPSIWSRVGANGGYVAAGILLGTATQDTQLLYSPIAAGTEQILLDESNNTGDYFYYSTTTQLIQADNSSTATTGYVNFVIKLSPSSTSEISSVQLVGLETNESSMPYQQQTVNRQKDQLFHYYQDWLNAKPIPSYLTGWDFPLNPAQFWGNNRAAQAIGANKSEYKWDQTIVFQSVDSGVGITRATNGSLKLTAALTGQTAVIQYLDAVQAKKLLSDRMAVNFKALSDNASGLVGTVSLWATDDASLPVVTAGTNNSIVLTLDANGKPATRNGAGWVEVPRSDLGDAKFTLSSDSTEYNFRGWDMEAHALVTTATYFAIVIGFASLTATKIIEIEYASLCSGDIATRPAPLTPQEVLSNCEQYYEKSYSNSVVPGTVTSVNALTKMQSSRILGSNASNFIANQFSVDYRTVKRSNTPTVSIYTASTGAAVNVDATIKSVGTVTSATASAVIALTQWTIANLGDRTFSYLPNYGANANPNIACNDSFEEIVRSWITFHYVVDARLGIV